VLVDGLSQADAAREFGMTPSALGNAVRRYRAWDADARLAYKAK
jgi:transposase-like protein